MKGLLIIMFMLTIGYSNASIEYTESKQTELSQTEVTSNRACFEELAKQGCGDPGEDHRHFRSCLHDAFASLTESCQKMMSNLYAKRK